MRLSLLALTAAALLATPALAAPLELALPDGAAVSAEATTAATSYRLLTGPWQEGAGPASTLEGMRTDTAWRLRADQETTLQILAPLRD